MTALEVKSGARRTSLPGMAAFADRYEVDRRLVVGGDGVALEDFFSSPVRALARVTGRRLPVPAC